MKVEFRRQWDQYQREATEKTLFFETLANVSFVPFMDFEILKNDFMKVPEYRILVEATSEDSFRRMFEKPKMAFVGNPFEVESAPTAK